MRFISACLVVILLFFTSIAPAFGQSDYNFPKITSGEIQGALQKTVPVRFLPGHPLYFLISTKEAVNRFFKPSAVERSQFDLTLSGKRLKETYMLMVKSDYKRAGGNLTRYAKQNESVIRQLEKARSQNQAVEPAISQMADSLRFHEELLIAIYDMKPASADTYNFDGSFSQAIDGFRALVGKIDNINPGIKNRFKISKANDASESAIVNPSPQPSATPVEATPTYKPRRIIY
ncbi:MAG: hypothetical protein UT84_C0001G0045 [Candidatus Curtissbacteria bacterium GW2011_GWA1_40_16]|uniref:DUF5667 domain-containing protein n=1 Tax=Candidatus Curtissbacteria bacterium GW2011_GWA1_40_16 TaxID=1618405 RepID=A0A0G0TW90_9BACT|nr:MAG: hypothetical protein UT84_C0001G0045 [Candidatus Curtissbacteria bacterium GW2011_GWA1_40_16]